jgi:hypothetical protein
MKEKVNVLKRLDRIQAELTFIREHMVDADVLLTTSERRLLERSIQNEQDGKLVPLEAIRNVRRKTR